MRSICHKITDKNNIILKKYFLGTSKFEELNRVYRGKATHDSASCLEIDLLENELLDVLENPGQSEENRIIIENAKKFYNQFVQELLSSNATNVTDVILESTMFTKFRLYDNNTKEKINNRKEEIKKKIDDFAERYLKGEKLTEQEYKVLFSFDFDGQIREWQENIFKKIIGIDKGFINFYEYKFICEYINTMQSIDLEYETPPIYYGDYIPFLNPKTGEIEKRKIQSIRTNIGVASIQGIFMNTVPFFNDYMTLKPQKETNILSLSSIISIISHESEHMKQNFDNYTNKLTKENLASCNQGFLYDNYSVNYDAYHVNYDFHETEFQANYQSCMFRKELIEDYIESHDVNNALKERFEKELEQINKKITELLTYHAYAMIIPNPTKKESKVESLEEYMPIYMEARFKKSPQLLEQTGYKIYNNFLNRDGTLKSIEELANKFVNLEITDKKRKEEVYMLYEPFLTYALEKTPNLNLTPNIVKVIDFLREYEEEQYRIMKVNENMFKYSIEHHLKSLDKRYTPEIADEMIRKRKKKINKYESLLQKYEDLLENKVIAFLSQNDVYKKYSILINELKAFSIETISKTQDKKGQEFLQDKKQQIRLIISRLIDNVRKFMKGDIKSQDIYTGLTSPEDILTGLQSNGILNNFQFNEESVKKGKMH